MEYNTRSFVRIRSIAFAFLACSLFATLLNDSAALAQGKLRRVKEAVRKNEPKPSKPSKPAPDRNRRDDQREDQRENHSNHDDHDSNHDVDNSRHDRHRPAHNDHRSHGHHRQQSSASIVIHSAPRRCIEPVAVPVVAYPVIPYQQPVIIQRPVPVQSVPPQQVYESIVVAEPTPSNSVSPAPHVISEPIFEPALVASSLPIGQEVIIVEPMPMLDWFETDTSRLWATIGSDFDGITSGGLGLVLQSPDGPGIEGSVMTLRESSDYYRDHLWIGDVNLIFGILEGNDIRGRVGLGVNWLSDSWGAEAGFNLTAGVDFRLSERWLFSAEGDLGNLGDADFFHGRLNLTRRFETCEWIVGADHYNIGGAEINSMFTGLQFRF